jgi:transposase-like protein
MFNREFSSLLEFTRIFGTEEACIAHLEELYWEGVPVSPFNPESKVYKCKNGKYRCAETKKYFDVTHSTMFQGCKVDLPTFFMAIYLITSLKRGISSYDLAEELKVSQKTAWFLLHRIRACCGAENMQPLSGIVEADESMVGGKQKNRHLNKRFKGTGGRSTIDKDAVFGMVERGGRIVLVNVPDCDGTTLQPIIKKLVEPGAVFITDSWNAYNGLESDYLAYQIKDTVNGYKNDYNPEIHTNSIEGAWRHVKAAISGTGTYNHVATKHLQFYLHECAYRYNLRDKDQNYKFNYLVNNSGIRTKYKILTR